MADSGVARFRPLRPEERMGRFVGALRSLVLHCKRFSDEVDRVVVLDRADLTSEPIYDPAPTCDIAAQLRKLVGEGRGDDLFRRVCEGTGATVPRVELTPDAAIPTTPWDKVVVEYFAMGSVPAGDGSGQAIPVTEIGTRICLALMEPGENVTLVSWGELVKQVADKDGVHLDHDRPIVWDFINAYHVGLVPGIPFLLYRLALTIVQVGNELLSSIGEDGVELDLTHSLGGMRCDAMEVLRTVKRAGSRPGRNERCPCGSGRKFKHCCGSG